MYCISGIWVRKETDLVNMGGELTLIKEMGCLHSDSITS